MATNESCEHGKYCVVCSCLIIEFVEKLIEKRVRVGEFTRYKGNTTRNIIGSEMETVVFDRWFSVGSLLDYVNREMKVKYVTLLKLFQNRIEEMKSIPAEQFREMADGKEIAFIRTSLRNYQGEAKLIVIWFQEDGEDKYYGYLTNDEDTSEEKTVTIYAKRWGIENFFKFEKFLNIQAFIKSKGETILVTYYRYPPELVPLFPDSNEKLRVFDERGLKPKDIQDFKDLQRLPYLIKHAFK